MSNLAPSGEAAVRRTRFAAFQSRDFRLLWIGVFISGIGTQMQFVAINYQVYNISQSPFALGAVGLFRVIPIIGLSLFAGLIADAVDRRRLLFFTQIFMMVVAAALAFLTATGAVTVWMIYLLTMLSAAAVAFDNPARQSLVPNLVPRENFANAASLNTIAWQGANIIGPAAAGLIIGRLGLATVYWINAASFIAVLIALVLMRTRVPSGGMQTVSLGALKEGLRFVFSTPIIRSTMFLDFVATFFGAAQQLLPIFAQEMGVGAEGLGILYSATAIGAVVASVVMSFIHRLRHQGPVLLVSVGIYGLATIVFGLSRNFWLTFAALAVTGAADIVSTVIRQTVRQLATPDRLRGRMVSVNMIFFMGGPQLGELEAGVLAGFVGAPLSVAIGGLACVACVFTVGYFSKTLRRYDDERSLDLPGAAAPAPAPAASVSPASD
ncbi:MAG: MFS transporter [Anaerolineae bacterium]